MVSLPEDQLCMLVFKVQYARPALLRYFVAGGFCVNRPHVTPFWVFWATGRFAT